MSLSKISLEIKTKMSSHTCAQARLRSHFAPCLQSFFYNNLKICDLLRFSDSLCLTAQRLYHY